MKISTRGQYSLEALLYLALLGEGESASTRTIAGATGISEGYLEQLLIPLKKAGIVRGIRGARGGNLPGKPLAEITVGEILRTVEGSFAPVPCLEVDASCEADASCGANRCPAQDSCIARPAWIVLYQEINDTIESITLADLAAGYTAKALAGGGSSL